MYITNRKDPRQKKVLVDDFILKRDHIVRLSRKMEWQPIYSDAYQLINGQYRRYHLTLWQFFFLFFFSYKFQVKMPNGMVWYPFATRKRNLSFAYRSDNGFGPVQRHIQAAATIAAIAVNIIKPFHRPQLVFEKLSERAQESGFAYFNYVRSHYPKEKLYFLIKQGAPDFEKIKNSRHIVLYGSFRHFYLLHRAVLFVSSETPGHAYFWRENMGITANVVRTKPYIFLQHGVLGFKKLDNIFYGDRLTAPTLLITSSQFEHNIVTTKLGYDPHRVPVTGLARWDMIDLEQERLSKRDKILLFYTWRPWLDDVSEDKFRESAYFQHLNNILISFNDSMLDKKIILMMHPKVRATMDKKLLSQVKLWTNEDGPLNELLTTVAAIITDYSSLSWEAYYREIPVIFDMFDQERYASEVGSYIDLDRIPFGNKLTSQNSVQVLIQKIQNNNYHLTDIELEQKSKYFAFEDRHSSERIHKAIQNVDLTLIRRAKQKAMLSAIKRMI
ncbi:CDP-glycerol glycerophosphotransferase family protein [Leuconostoc mesenteroides]|uniref:CDP-glycerol glycerophosphotransferase family protein n=1 Tax=Leuconostoc mesenteroides TaxID=1245 RepID=UPI0021A2C4F6|nr:CDP-glycerol glycerophosphotransferase family protein [Leuconostoc mesenteroides]MCT3053866.1 hypothetical protein [Leuconostoc mesenteroides]